MTALEKPLSPVMKVTVMQIYYSYIKRCDLFSAVWATTLETRSDHFVHKQPEHLESYKNNG